MRTKACGLVLFGFFFTKAPMRVGVRAVMSVVGGSRNLFGNGH